MPETCAPVPHAPVELAESAGPTVAALEGLRARADAARSYLERLAADCPAPPVRVAQGETVTSWGQYVEGIVTDTLHGGPAQRDAAVRRAARLHALALAPAPDA